MMYIIRDKMDLLETYICKFILVICKGFFEWAIKMTSYGFVVYCRDEPRTLGELLKETNECINDTNEMIEMYKD